MEFTGIRALHEPSNNIKLGKRFVDLGWENYGLSVLDSGAGKYFANEPFQNWFIYRQPADMLS